MKVKRIFLPDSDADQCLIDAIAESDAKQEEANERLKESTASVKREAEGLRRALAGVDDFFHFKRQHSAH